MNYIDIKKFKMGWRFTDENYNLLPSGDLLKIKPIIESDSEIIWRKYVSQNHRHLMLLGEDDIRYETVLRLNWEDEKSGKKILSDIQGIDYSQAIIFMWSPKNSVETIWGLVVNYWTDFFYPSDDNIVILFKEKKLKMHYCEENLFIYNTRKIISF